MKERIKILALLAQKGPMTGTTIEAALQESRRNDPHASTLQRAVRRAKDAVQNALFGEPLPNHDLIEAMEHEGLLTSAPTVHESEHAGRLLFSITPQGAARIA